ncbi:MAG: PH domain-containing protein [Parvularculaceae bacterium]|nr:PH domain-containing protein [Parvularculaceae bacterium]
MAGYVEKTLASDEHIEYEAEFNWTFNVESWLWCLAAGLTALFYCWLQFSVGIRFDALKVGWWLTGAAIGLALIFLLIHYIYLYTTEIVVTTFRLVFKTGWISRSTQEVSLNKIEEITLEQSVIARLFDFGKLVIRGTGVGVIELPNLDKPIRVRKVIEDARAKLRQGSAAHQRSGEED